MCPYGRAEQDGTHLGSYTGWKSGADGKPDHTTMLLPGGSLCWNGPARSIEVHFECGVDDRLLSVDEPSKCTYAAKASSPAACDGRATKELLMSLEPEL